MHIHILIEQNLWFCALKAAILHDDRLPWQMRLLKCERMMQFSDFKVPTFNLHFSSKVKASTKNSHSSFPLYRSLQRRNLSPQKHKPKFLYRTTIDWVETRNRCEDPKQRLPFYTAHSIDFSNSLLFFCQFNTPFYGVASETDENSIATKSDPRNKYSTNKVKQHQNVHAS